MKTLISPTDEFIKVEATNLSVDAPAGSNVTLTVSNNNGLSEGDYLCIGYEGNELAELVQIDQPVVAGQLVRISSMKFNHQAGEPIVKYRYNKVKFYGSTSIDGSYVELTGDGSPVTIQVDDPMGSTLEYTGSSYTYFKSTYYNSTTLEETDIEDSTAVIGDTSLRYATLYAIRKHAGLHGNTRYSDLRIETKRSQAENEIDSVLAAKYTLPLTEVPPLLGQICELLAAGYIDFEEFGKDGEGVKWLGEARALLKAIRNGTQILIGASGEELTRVTGAGRVQSNTADSDPVFSMSDTF